MRQIGFKNHFSKLLIANFMVDGTVMTTTTDSVFRQVLTVPSQVPEPHPGDPHKAEFRRTLLSAILKVVNLLAVSQLQVLHFSNFIQSWK